MKVVSSFLLAASCLEPRVWIQVHLHNDAGLAQNPSQMALLHPAGHFDPSVFSIG